MNRPTGPTAPVTRLRPADAEELLGMVLELTRRVEYLSGKVEKHETTLGDVDEALDAHEDRLNAVEAARPAREPSLPELVEKFVNAHADMRLTAVVVAESMGHVDPVIRKRINSTLVSLAEQGRIGVDVREGRNRVFYANPAPAAVTT